MKLIPKTNFSNVVRKKLWSKEKGFFDINYYLSNYILTTFLEFSNHQIPSDTCPLKNHLDKTHSEYSDHIYSRVLLMAYLVFFCSSIAVSLPPLVLPSTCLNFLLNTFWAIQQELPAKNGGVFLVAKSLACSIHIYWSETPRRMLSLKLLRS